MIKTDKPSQLPAPVSLTLEEAMQVAGGLTGAQIIEAVHLVGDHIVIGRPAFTLADKGPFEVPGAGSFQLPGLVGRG